MAATSAPRRLGRPASAPFGRLVLCAHLALGLACGDRAPSELTEGPSERTDDAPAPLSERSDVAGILAALHRSHATIRAETGPHRLGYTAEFELVPERPSDGPPKLDQPIEVAMKVHDEVELIWASTNEKSIRMSLQQSNDREDRRDLVIVDEVAYTRLWEPQWYRRPLDGDIHELWLDDAQRSVHDLVEFMAPRVKLEFAGEGEIDGVRALRWKLTLSDAVETALGRDGDPSLWRAAAEIQSVAGELALDASSGAWLSAQLDVTWRMHDAAGRAMKGHASLDGSVKRGEFEVQPPSGSVPMPERQRYEPERRKLLDGLAAP